MKSIVYDNGKYEIPDELYDELMQLYKNRDEVIRDVRFVKELAFGDRMKEADKALRDKWIISQKTTKTSFKRTKSSPFIASDFN